MRTTHGPRSARSTAMTFLAAASVAAAVPLPAQSARRALHVDPSLRDCSVRFAPVLTQRAFHRFVREFGSLSAFKQVAPPGTLGRGRVLLGIETIRFQIDEWSDAWHDTFYHPNDRHPLGATKVFPKLRIRAGVTDRVDVGAFYTRNLDANYGWVGLDGRYALLREEDAAPVALAVRGAYTKTLYVHDMDMHALTVDVSVGRRLWRVVRPYAGVGADGMYTRETSAAVALRREAIVAPHLFGGVDVTAWRRLSAGVEFTVGPRPSAQVQVGGVAF